MFNKRNYRPTFFSAPESVTSFVAAFLEPFVTVGTLLAVMLHLNESVLRPDLALCLLEGITGSVEAVLFPRTLQQAGSLFVDDAPVLARGRLNIREDRANSLLIDEIKPLGEVNKTVYIRFESLPESETQRACAFLKRYPGETPVVLYDAAKKLGKGVPKEYYVAVTDAFLAAAEDRFGKECIKLK